jgi:hypothetical protein
MVWLVEYSKTDVENYYFSIKIVSYLKKKTGFCIK